MDIFSSYNKILISGFPAFGMNTRSVRDLLTGISFVTKRNHDIEAQLADIAAHYLNIEARMLDNVQTNHQNLFDELVIKVLRSKTFYYQSSLTSAPENSLRRLY